MRRIVRDDDESGKVEPRETGHGDEGARERPWPGPTPVLLSNQRRLAQPARIPNTARRLRCARPSVIVRLSRPSLRNGKGLRNRLRYRIGLPPQVVRFPHEYVYSERRP